MPIGATGSKTVKQLIAFFFFLLFFICTTTIRDIYINFHVLGCCQSFRDCKHCHVYLVFSFYLFKFTSHLSITTSCIWLRLHLMLTYRSQMLKPKQSKTKLETVNLHSAFRYHREQRLSIRQNNKLIKYYFFQMSLFQHSGTTVL